LIDRNEKPIGQRLLQRLCGSRADLTGEACGAAGIWHAFADSTSFTQAVVPEESGTALGEYPRGVFGRAIGART